MSRELQERYDGPDPGWRPAGEAIRLDPYRGQQITEACDQKVRRWRRIWCAITRHSWQPLDSERWRCKLCGSTRKRHKFKVPKGGTGIQPPRMQEQHQADSALKIAYNLVFEDEDRIPPLRIFPTTLRVEYDGELFSVVVNNEEERLAVRRLARARLLGAAALVGYKLRKAIPQPPAGKVKK